MMTNSVTAGRLAVVVVSILMACASCTSDAPTAASTAPQASVSEQSIESVGAVAADSGMPGCGERGRPCCGSCQEKLAQKDPAAQSGGGCPCQRAREARERAQREKAGS